MGRIKRIRSVMHRDDERAVFGCSLELLREPALLLECALAIQLTIDVRVESDNRGQRRVERPINVGLRHRRPMFEDVMWAWGAEILDETKQRRFIIGRVAG